MRISFIRVLLLGTALAAAVCGCKKAAQAPERPVAKPTPPAPETLARIHWLGKKRLAEDPKATNVLSIWAMPEGVKLQAYTLDKMASAASRLFGSRTNETGSNMVTSPLRPLLEDLVDAETWLELRQVTNQPPEIAIALKLSPDRAEFWETNLASGLEALTGGAHLTNTAGWTFNNNNTPKLVQFARGADWTVVAFSEQPSSIIPDLLSNITAGTRSFKIDAINAFLELDVNLPRAARALGTGTLPSYFPRISLASSFQAEVVRTVGELLFPAPLPLKLDPWELPTNIIHQPLIAFTALRGFAPFLSELPWWKRMDAGPPPNQAFVWSLGGMPLLTYFIAPMPDASNAVLRVSEYMMREVKPLMETNAFGTLELSTNPLALGWVDLPMINPYLSYIETNGVGYALSGVVPNIPLRDPFPPELIAELDRHTNLVWYDWEITAGRLEAVLNLGQLLRFSSGKPQLVVDSAPMRFLKAVGPKLGNCATVLTQTAPNQLSLIRKSPIGLSALELHLISDWLESPDFPAGLHTTRATNAILRSKFPLKTTPAQSPVPGATNLNDTAPK